MWKRYDNATDKPVLRVQGEEVVFLEACKHNDSYYDSFMGETVYTMGKKQKWRVPELKLFGWVVTETEKGIRSVEKIRQDIQTEVTFDLEQRHKRELGIL